MNARKTKAKGAYYEARKQFFDDQASQPADGSVGSPPPNGETREQYQAPNQPQRPPSHPRILDLAIETNIVGVSQQEYHLLGGEKYGFYTVVSDAYFDGGPTVRARVYKLVLLPVR